MATITWEEIKAHNTEADTWIVLHGNVYNVTKFLEDHPGGIEIILEVAGQDATDVFEEAAHSSEARDILVKLLVGRLKEHHHAVQTFDSVIGKAAQVEAKTGSWTRVILQAVLSFVAFTSLAYNRDNILEIWPHWRQGFNNADPMWISAVAVLLLSLGAFGTFVSHVIYVDFGRLDKYPSRLRIE
ncbi:hypothetical protein MMC14_001845 [Varicellaria rhodocarpa]|nr:hypothetical protein [Varicellaria rhodocarpa]